MPKHLSLILIPFLIPLTASADDDPPPPVVDPWVDADRAEAEPWADAAPTPGEPVISAPGTAPPVQPANIADPCEVEKRGWRKARLRMKGKLSIGFSRSHVELADDTEGTQRSFVAQLHGKRGWSIELELGRLKLDGGDVAKTGGAALVKQVGNRRLRPYVLAGAGGGRYESADGFEQRVRFAEIGGGLMLKKKRLSIGVDVRRGVRRIDAGDEVSARMTTPEADDDGERYTRGRVLALINF
jgi:hypothetical protein